MNKSEWRATLGTCANIENGCFARDPEAFICLIRAWPGAIQSTLVHITDAADAAAVKGVPLESVTYQEYGNRFDKFKEILLVEKVRDARMDLIVVETVEETMKLDLIDLVKARVARCAYACGGVAAETCAYKSSAFDDSVEEGLKD